MVEPRSEVKIGAIVTTTDGDYGHLKQLLLDPRLEQIIGVLVQPHGLLPYHPVVVPHNLIADASEKEVRLKISRGQLEALPKYGSDSQLVVEGDEYEVDDELFAVREKQKLEVVRAPGAREPGMIGKQLSGSESIRFGLRLRAGQLVFCRGAYAGRASLILLDPNGRVKGFVLHAGPFPLIGRDLIVPAASIQEVDRGNIHLSVARQDLERLPDYRSDELLGAAVDHALWSDEILKNTDYPQIGLSVEDGVVQLRGHVVTSTNKRNAEDAAYCVPGVLHVENDLVVDDDLLFEVAQALGRNDVTRSERIAIGVRNGFITLNGYVASTVIRDDAEAIAASIPRVRGVVNYLHTPNVIIDYKDEPIWQPHIGQQVYAADMQLGQVERVIIDPRNRRVIAFVVRGIFPDPQNKDGYRLPSDDSQEERSVVIPIDAIRNASDGPVLLEVRGAEAARYRAFDPADFKSPPVAWQPPYPYRCDQVLFDGERLEESKVE